MNETFSRICLRLCAWTFGLFLAATPASAQVIDGYAPDRAPAGPNSGIHTYKPTYPREFKRNREQVTGVLRVFIGRSGSIDRVEIARYTGVLPLMQYARTYALRTWRAEPRPVPPGSKGRWREVPITFVLNDGGMLLRYVEKVRGPNHPDTQRLRESELRLRGWARPTGT